MGYYVAYLAVALSALISMPITTRLLSTEEYGLLSLALAMVSLLAGSALLGLSQATLRLLPEERLRGKLALARFCESMLTGALCSGLLLAAIAATVLPHLGYGPHTSTMQLACALVVVRVAVNIVAPIYRAMQRVRVHVAIQVTTRYGTLALAIALLMTGRARANDVLLAALISEGIVLAVCLISLFREEMLRGWRFAASDLRRAVSYGFPLAIATASGFLIESGDRFLIERWLNLDAVAGYAVAYDLTQRLAETAFAPVQMAVLPILYQLWTEDRQDAVRRYVAGVATYVLALALPLAALFLVLVDDVIVLLASAKYAHAAALVPILLPGIFLGEMSFVVAVGLRLTKRTGTAAGIALAGAVVNLLLNAVWLPRWGLAGAAAATTATYLMMGIAIYLRVRHVVVLQIRRDLIGKSLIVSGAMAAAVRALPPLSSALVLDLAIRAFTGLSITVAAFCALDRETRNGLRQLWSSRQGRPVTAR